MLCVVKTTRNEAYFILSYTGAISEKMRKISIIDTSLKITNYRLHPHLPMAKKASRHWGRVTHVCVGKLTMIGSDNGLSPGRRQAIIWTNAGILCIGPVGTKFNEILIGIQTFSANKMHLKMSSAKWRPFVLASICLFIFLFSGGVHRDNMVIIMVLRTPHRHYYV